MEVRSRLPALDVASRITPGCVMKGDVAITRSENGNVRLWEVQCCSGGKVKLLRLQQKDEKRVEVVKGIRVTVRWAGARWDAKVVKSPNTSY